MFNCVEFINLFNMLESIFIMFIVLIILIMYLCKLYIYLYRLNVLCCPVNPKFKMIIFELDISDTFNKWIMYESRIL